MTTEIQSVLFDKKVFNLKQSRACLKKHKFRTHFRNKSPKDETEKYYRFRQKEPYLYKTFRTKKITKGLIFIFGIK